MFCIYSQLFKMIPLIISKTSRPSSMFLPILIPSGVLGIHQLHILQEVSKIALKHVQSCMC